MNQCAFDYDAQRWVVGPEASAVLLQHRSQELELLAGPDGDRYAQFVGVTDRAGQIAWLRREIELLKGGAS